MLKSIKYDDVFYKFHHGNNYISDKKIIDIAITSFGGFTDAFDNGVGRRVELDENIEELSVNTFATINKKDFHFARCYTFYQVDTRELDKKQDIVKYASKLNNQLVKKDVVLPIIAYYNESTKMEDVCYNLNNDNIFFDRTYGYNNCLIVKNKFENTQKFFVLASALYYQYKLSNKKQTFYKNYNRAICNIKKSINTIGYSSLYYDFGNNALFVIKSGKRISVKSLNEDEQIYLMIIFDLNMRAIMLNPDYLDPFSVSGCVGITYKFDDSKKNKLLNIINKQFSKLQILI